MKSIITFSALLLFWAAASCQSNSKATGSELLDVQAFETRMNTLSDEQLIDVRTPEEYAAGHLAGAVNMNIYDADFAQRIAKLDKSRPVMVYCKAGGRSGDAAKQLSALGYAVSDLKGGTLAWANAGKALETAGTAVKAGGLTPEQFQQQVSAQPLVLVDFKATWCKPCKMLAPILDELVKKQEGRLTLIKIDADENPELMKAKQINSIPYLELYRDGKLVWTHMGLTDEATIAAQLK
jgi:thioredoxin